MRTIPQGRVRVTLCESDAEDHAEGLVWSSADLRIGTEQICLTTAEGKLPSETVEQCRKKAISEAVKIAEAILAEAKAWETTPDAAFPSEPKQDWGVVFDNANTITDRDDLPGTTFRVIANDEEQTQIADVRGDRHSPEGIKKCQALAFLIAAAPKMRDACLLAYQARTPEELQAARQACADAYASATTVPEPMP